MGSHNSTLIWDIASGSAAMLSMIDTVQVDVWHIVAASPREFLLLYAYILWYCSKDRGYVYLKPVRWGFHGKGVR